MIREIEHTCPCGLTWRVWYEEPATVDPVCPQCGRQSGIVREKAGNNEKLVEQPTSTLTGRTETW